MLCGERSARTGEEGFTFLEVLITLALLSVAFIAILTAVASMVIAGDQHKKLSTSETVIRNLGEYVKQEATTPYTLCTSNPVAAYQAKVISAPAGTFPAGYTTTVTSVEPWDGNNPAAFPPGGCARIGDTGVQLVTVTVTATSFGSPYTQTLAVVKRSPS